MRNGRARKEVYLSSAEETMIKEFSTKFHCDKTATIRMLMGIGAQVLTNALNNTTPHQITIIHPGRKKI